MQAASFRYFLLTALLLVGAGVYATLGSPTELRSPRSPMADAVYNAQSWVVSPPQLQQTSDTELVTRVYRDPADQTATLTIVTKRTPKLYVAGADVPFLGAGYTVAAAPHELVRAANKGVDAMIARRGSEQWLVMYTYGERRGLLGNGPLAWSLGVWDGLLGHSNDYYKLYLSARVDSLDPTFIGSTVELANSVFPQIASWYATA
jgi:hypothetical protein